MAGTPAATVTGQSAAQLEAHDREVGVCVCVCAYAYVSVFVREYV